MIAEPQKTCTKCGERKPLSEFYFQNKGRGRKKAHSADCKACYKVRVAKRLAEREGRTYRPMQRLEPTFCERCKKRITHGSRHCHKHAVKESKFGAWGKVIACGYSETAGATDKFGEWTDRVYSTLTSLHIRERSQVVRKVRNAPGTWAQAITQAKGRLRPDDKYGRWTRKIRNAVHNWAIKSRAKAERRRIVRSAGSTEVQMRFDW